MIAFQQLKISARAETKKASKAQERGQFGVRWQAERDTAFDHFLTPKQSGRRFALPAHSKVFNR
jgi:hypothetical protein